MILPTVVLGMLTSAAVMRLTRSAMIDVMGMDFIRTARAKGLRERTVILRHALRHALLPVVTILGIQLGRLIAGSVIVETVFAWPGVGRLTISAIQGSDYPVVQLSIMLIASTIVLANIAVDLSYRLIDPRIRAGTA
jgi:ABC-type dipeptide/oligopeptide/nickel transport system permease component